MPSFDLKTYPRTAKADRITGADTFSYPYREPDAR